MGFDVADGLDLGGKAHGSLQEFFNGLNIEPLAKFGEPCDLKAGIANFRIGLPRPTPEEGIPALCSLPFPVF
jgi:hypothetical protein